MNVTVVQSSTLATIAYDSTRELLQLEFNSHAVYQYLGVPVSVHEALLRALSKGRYFNQSIRGRFPYSRLSHGQEERVEQDMPAERQR
jgi:KTSC domain-containing protein